MLFNYKYPLDIGELLFIAYGSNCSRAMKSVALYISNEISELKRLNCSISIALNTKKPHSSKICSCGKKEEERIPI